MVFYVNVVTVSFLMTLFFVGFFISIPTLTPNACECRDWPTSSVFINFEYESNGFCKYSKGEICWHGVGEN